MTKPLFLRLALPVPLRQCFDYLPPDNCPESVARKLQPGVRLLVPFGKRQLVGVLLGAGNTSDYPASRIKPALRTLDDKPLLPPDILSLCQWASDYYQHPLGEVIFSALPVRLRKGLPLYNATETRWRLTDHGLGLPEGALPRAPKQARLLKALQENSSINREMLDVLGISRQVARQLIAKGLAETFEQPVERRVELPTPSASESGITLNREQRRVLSAIKPTLGTFHCFLLNGVTGSGKTEIYLQLIESILKRQQQALVLIPEIGLTPQTLSRFQNRFKVPIAVLHSALNDAERATAWQAACSGEARIIIGTRSALFTPMPDLGLIVVDEEHDSSFKQQEGFRYSARDMAVKRARDKQITIILGSATPSLESLYNAAQGRYTRLDLTRRAGQAILPEHQVTDIRHTLLQEGLSEPLLQAIRETLDNQCQALVFINRRGYAPTLTCNDCGWIADCQHCDSRLTVHKSPSQLQCHHCGTTTYMPRSCPCCHGSRLAQLGQGTQRSEEALARLFPDTPVIRIDGNTTSKKNALQNRLAAVEEGKPCILVGTQMLAKGHHFPGVTLAALIDADSSLYSSDFRGAERMGQLLTQVAGRAGRGEAAGQVIIQTRHPDNPLLETLLEQGYLRFAEALLAERELTGLPPYHHLAILRTESAQANMAEAFLSRARNWLDENFSELDAVGPLPAVLARKAGKYRFTLLIKSARRATLNLALSRLTAVLEQNKEYSRVRFAIDVDPQETL
jgi:primosomal protein N' (replication factor Y)